MPLALELAAARLCVLTAEQLAARLSNRFRLLASAQRGGLARHQTLLARSSGVMTCSSKANVLCSAGLRRLRMAGRSSLPNESERVCSFDGLARADVLDMLAQFVEKSLAQVERREGTTRYRLLEMLRAYALSRLELTEEADANEIG
jgi:predicted ATPase